MESNGTKCFYRWDNQLKIVIYGVNIYSKKLTARLKRLDFVIYAYIDKRADELVSVNGIPVYDMENFFREIEIDDVCVIIMLQNALQHDDIAFQLFSKGIGKIIFAPMELQYSEQYACYLREVYNLVLIGDFESIVKIPYYRNLVCEEQGEVTEEIQEKNSKFLTVRVLADIVYTNPKEAVNGKDNLLKYADMPLIAYEPYNQMFEYFWRECQGRIPNEYLDDYGVNSCNYANSFSNSNIIFQREQLYEIWNEHFQKGMNFFISSAPLAAWNNKGYFNLLEGQHRTLFLLKRGIYYLPLRISKRDWLKWQNLKKYEELKKLKYSLQCYTPIQNPYFQTESFYNKISIVESMLSIQQNVPRELYEGKEIINYDDMLGYYGFNLRRMGAASVTIYALDNEKKSAMEVLLGLYGLSNVLFCSNEDWQKNSCYPFISIIGISEELKKFKYYVIKHINEISNITLLVSLTDLEMELVDDAIKLCLLAVSKVFIGTEMHVIYLLKREQ